MSRMAFSGAIILILSVAALLRLPHLERRPMHGDEAVHAVKFGELLENATYRYDPHEYHGPTLNFLTLLPAWFSGRSNFAELDEKTLRLVPVAAGIVLVVLPLLLHGLLPMAWRLWAAVFLAVSPAFVFYSRYYIQEILLVAFTAGFFVLTWRWIKQPGKAMGLFAGILAALMHATKETWVLQMLAAMIAVTLCWPALREHKWPKLAAWVWPVAGYLAGVALLFSTFGQHPGGVWDAFATYGTYLQRGTMPSVHEQPWWFYLYRLHAFQIAPGPLWTEAGIWLAAVVGIVVAGWKSDLRVQLLGAYATSLTLIYSLISYKTPWNLINFHAAWIMLAGFGLWSLAQRYAKAAKLVNITGGALLLWLAWLSYQSTTHYYEDPRNPHVYAHPTRDVQEVGQAIEAIAKASDEKRAMQVQIIAPGDDYWPLPWYLRKFQHTGWFTTADSLKSAAPVMVFLPDAEAGVINLLYERLPRQERELYIPLFEKEQYLRPTLPLRAYAKKSYWDRAAAEPMGLAGEEQ